MCLFVFALGVGSCSAVVGTATKSGVGSNPQNECGDDGSLDPAGLSVETEIGKGEKSLCLGKVTVYFEKCEDDCDKTTVRLRRMPKYSKEKFSLRDEYLLEPVGLERRFSIRYDLKDIEETDIGDRSWQVSKSFSRQRLDNPNRECDCSMARAWTYEWFPMTVMVKVDPKRMPKEIESENTCYVSKDHEYFYDGCAETRYVRSRYGDDHIRSGWTKGPYGAASIFRKCSFLGQVVWGWDILEKNYTRNFLDSKPCNLICHNPCDDK